MSSARPLALRSSGTAAGCQTAPSGADLDPPASPHDRAIASITRRLLQQVLGPAVSSAREATGKLEPQELAARAWNRPVG